MTTGNNLGPPGGRDDDARPKPGHAEPAATTAPRYNRKNNPPPRQCGPDPRPWRRRRAASWRLVPLDCGCRDPWPCRCTSPALSDAALDGWRDAANHVLAGGLTPLVPIEVRRALWRRQGADRLLAERLHQACGEVVVMTATVYGTPTVKRTVFATPRAAEFLELRALQAQTGQPVEAFGHVVVKELLDNALDAAETAGRAPIVDIGTRTDDGVMFVTVSDNGAGITPATVTDLCDFTMLVSDKARYRGPARGAQGNALKTLLGIPYALNLTDPVIIESTGIRHELQVTVDPVGDVVVTHQTTTSDRAVGTSVTVPLPAHLDIDAGRWAYGAALVNPHATITAIDHADSDTDSDTGFYKPSGEVWSKWTPSRRPRRTGTTGPRSRRWCTAISARSAARVSMCRSGGSSPSSTACRAA